MTTRSTSSRAGVDQCRGGDDLLEDDAVGCDGPDEVELVGPGQRRQVALVADELQTDAGGRAHDGLVDVGIDVRRGLAGGESGGEKIAGQGRLAGVGPPTSITTPRRRARSSSIAPWWPSCTGVLGSGGPSYRPGRGAPWPVSSAADAPHLVSHRLRPRRRVRRGGARGDRPYRPRGPSDRRHPRHSPRRRARRSARPGASRAVSARRRDPGGGRSRSRHDPASGRGLDLAGATSSAPTTACWPRRWP